VSLVERYSAALGLGPDADEDALKAAYRRLARENHPDHFPVEDRARQAGRMAEINEAYRQLRRIARESAGKPRSDTARPARDRGRAAERSDPFAPRGVPSLERDVGLHRDPAYVNYKQGFVHYSAGAGGMMFRGRSAKITPDQDGLKRVLEALDRFLKAQDYFSRVVEEHPQSVWAADAEWKLVRIRGFLRIYRKIRMNLAGRLQEKTESV
jgi:DnaJ domain